MMFWWGQLTRFKVTLLSRRKGQHSATRHAGMQNDMQCLYSLWFIYLTCYSRKRSIWQVHCLEIIPIGSHSSPETSEGEEDGGGGRGANTGWHLSSGSSSSSLCFYRLPMFLVLRYISLPMLCKSNANVTSHFHEQDILLTEAQWQPVSFEMSDMCLLLKAWRSKIHFLDPCCRITGAWAATSKPS